MLENPLTGTVDPMRVLVLVPLVVGCEVVQEVPLQLVLAVAVVLIPGFINHVANLVQNGTRLPHCPQLLVHLLLQLLLSHRTNEISASLVDLLEMGASTQACRSTRQSSPMREKAGPWRGGSMVRAWSRLRRTAASEWVVSWKE